MAGTSGGSSFAGLQRQLPWHDMQVGVAVKGTAGPGLALVGEANWAAKSVMTCPWSRAVGNGR